jgi:SM-20-related protein
MRWTDEDVARLGDPGWLVRDGFLGQELARRVREEAATLTLKPAGVRRGAAHALDSAARNDAIAWLSADEATGPLREAALAFEGLMQSLNEAAWLGLRRVELQLARYAPGGHYARHRDAFPGDDNRRVTAIVYLNERWEPAHGGQLRLHVEPPMDIEPMLDRLVVFRSQLIEHEVLSAHAERWALTAWFSAR